MSRIVVSFDSSNSPQPFLNPALLNQKIALEKTRRQAEVKATGDGTRR